MYCLGNNRQDNIILSYYAKWKNVPEKDRPITVLNILSQIYSDFF